MSMMSLFKLIRTHPWSLGTWNHGSASLGALNLQNLSSKKRGGGHTEYLATTKRVHNSLRAVVIIY